jgi:hypothetical protein
MADRDRPDNLAVMEREVQALIGRVAERGVVLGRQLRPGDVTGRGRARRVGSARRPGLPPWAVAVVATAAVVVLLVFLIPSGNGRPSSTTHTAHGGTKPPATPTTAPFRVVGGAPQSAHLDCVTASVCYVGQRGGASLSGLVGERTTNGGASWQAMAPLPVDAALAWPFSCPTTTVCFSSVAGFGVTPVPSELATTNDGGRHWHMLHLPVPPLAGANQTPPAITNPSVDQLSCPTSRYCTAYLTAMTVASGPTAPAGGLPVGYFLTTRNAGATWTYARGAAIQGISVGEGFVALRCQRDGSCIGLETTATVTNGDASHERLATVHSVNFGRSWKATVWPLPVGSPVTLADCGDTTHCEAAYAADQGRLIEMARTANAGRTWRTQAEPAWPTDVSAMSCATAQDCFVATSTVVNIVQDSAPVLEATHDGGGSWSPLAMPEVQGTPLVDLYPLSCPVPAGCIGIGGTFQQVGPHQVPSPPPNTNRETVSNLGGRS